MGIDIDAIDKRILYYLGEEARRTSAPDIADEMDVTAATIRNRINRLEEAGVIQGYHAHINYGEVEDRLTNLFMCTTSATDRPQLAQQVLNIPGVVNVREVMSGRGDLQVKATGTDQDDLVRIAQDITALGVEIEEEGLLYRESFHPYAQFGPDGRDALSEVTSIVDFAGDVDVVEMVVGEAAPIAGMTLKEADEEGLLTTGTLILMIEREDRAITPSGETTIEAGDLITVLSRTGLDDEILVGITGQ